MTEDSAESDYLASSATAGGVGTVSAGRWTRVEGSVSPREDWEMHAGLSAAARSLCGLVVLGVLLFLPAGTLDYWRAWVFLATFTVSTAVPSIYLFRVDRAAFQRRLKAGQESRPAQQVAILLLLLISLAQLVLSAFDHRFGWSAVPAVVSLIGDAMLAIGLVLAMAVVIQNRYAAANVAVEGGQQVISTGLYGIVRHPMYSGALIMMVGIPLALGSWRGLGFVVPIVAVLMVRILDEEKMLEQELDGYGEYMRSVRFRMVPNIW